MLCCARRLSAQIGRCDLNRSIHNRSSFPVDAVRKWFATNGARGVFVAREDLGLAFRALSDRRRDRIPIVLDNLFLIHFCSSWTANVLHADVESPLLCPAFTHHTIKAQFLGGHGLYHSHKFISSLRHRALRLDSTRDAIHISFRSVLKLRTYELSI